MSGPVTPGKHILGLSHLFPWNTYLLYLKTLHLFPHKIFLLSEGGDTVDFVGEVKQCWTNHGTINTREYEHYSPGWLHVYLNIDSHVFEINVDNV